jgi:hypothetical protein
MPLLRINALRFGFALFATSALLVSCDSQQGGPEAVPLPESLAKPVESAGTRFQALAYANREQSEAAFGLDLRGAGLLPLRISIDNRGGAALKLIPRQTFLIDLKGQAWPLLTSSQTFDRLERAGIQGPSAPKLPELDDLESHTGFALNMVASARFAANDQAQADTRIGKTLQEKRLRNPEVPAGKVASGVLFFPGREEAEGAQRLRLCLEQEGRLKFLTLPLNP